VLTQEEVGHFTIGQRSGIKIVRVGNIDHHGGHKAVSVADPHHFYAAPAPTGHFLQNVGSFQLKCDICWLHFQQNVTPVFLQKKETMQHLRKTITSLQFLRLQQHFFL
jgi:hypothetical protein